MKVRVHNIHAKSFSGQAASPQGVRRLGRPDWRGFRITLESEHAFQIAVHNKLPFFSGDIGSCQLGDCRSAMRLVTSSEQQSFRAKVFHNQFNGST